MLDVFAAMACVEYLEPGAMDDANRCMTWLRQVKNLQVPIELVCSEESVRHYGECSRNMIGDIR